jgi:hypothetical protein
MRPISKFLQMLAKDHFIFVLRLFLSTILALWVLDVILNLALVKGFFLNRLLLGSFQDYLGLFLAEFQIALGAVVASGLFAAVLAFILASRNRMNEAVILLSALLAALTVLAGTRIIWDLRASQMRLALLISASTGLVLWLVLRQIVNQRSDGHWGFGEIIQWALFPALIIGFANDALAQTVKAAWSQAAIAGVATIFLLGLAILLLRTRSLIWSSSIRWLPVLLAVFLATYSSIGSQFYGDYQAEVGNDAIRHRPSIILIVLDTVRADHIRSYGYLRNTMPALERWAEAALVAKRAISPAGWTAPAHASIFSGRTVSRHGIHHHPESLGQTQPIEGISWLSDKLVNEGYYCLAVSANPMAVPLGGAGFNRVLAPWRKAWNKSTLAALVDNFSPLTSRISERLRWRMPWVDAKGIVDIAMRAVPDDEKPVFLFVNFMDAHSPYNPPASALKLLGVQAERLFGRYKQDTKLSRLWNSLPEGKMQSLVNLYDGDLRWLDLHLEKFLYWIDEHFGKDAIVIITSDHGEELGEKGRVGHSYGLSQSLIHVPLFVRSPGLGSGNLEEVVSTCGLYDFIYLSARGEAPSVESLIQADEHGLVSERYASLGIVRLLGAEYNRPWVSMIEGKYKAVGPSNSGFEFYDIETSGFDQEVAALHSPIEKTLQTRIDEYWAEFQDRREEAFELSKEERAALRALGYVQ